MKQQKNFIPILIIGMEIGLYLINFKIFLFVSLFTLSIIWSNLFARTKDRQINYSFKIANNWVINKAYELMIVPTLIIGISLFFVPPKIYFKIKKDNNPIKQYNIVLNHLNNEVIDSNSIKIEESNLNIVREKDTTSIKTQLVKTKRKNKKRKSRRKKSSQINPPIFKLSSTIKISEKFLSPFTVNFLIKITYVLFVIIIFILWSHLYRNIVILSMNKFTKVGFMFELILITISSIFFIHFLRPSIFINPPLIISILFYATIFMLLYHFIVISMFLMDNEK